MFINERNMNIFNDSIMDGQKYCNYLNGWSNPNKFMFKMTKLKKKSIFDHPTLAKVWFWPSNSKIGYLWLSNYQN
jgi:hypothetical protein